MMTNDEFSRAMREAVEGFCMPKRSRRGLVAAVVVSSLLAATTCLAAIPASWFF